MAAVLVAACLALGGCGRAAASAGDRAVTVALDFTPNPAHAPIYLASERGFDRRLGVRLDIVVPGSSGPDTVKLLLSHRADIGVLDIQDLALARERGIDVVGIAALVQRPLSAIIAQPYIQRPRQLDGRRVGVSGLPSDPAFLRALIDRDGGDYRTVKPVVIGFGAVAQMAAGNVAAVPAFWSDEGVALRLRGIHVREFRIEDFGAPVYPEVVLVALRSALRAHRGVIVRALGAIALGARYAVAHPGSAAAVITAASSGDPRLIAAQTAAIAPALLPPLRLQRGVLEGWERFDARTGLIARPLAVGCAFDFSVAPEGLALAGRGGG
ncbi:MAG TPA: ABC transporter substrate-binding protein [Solirubrobacteraceae bacterium]|nr:ABC transporter substrate-binding protein [Solirubrobacteraceae bacterium]